MVSYEIGFYSYGSKISAILSVPKNYNMNEKKEKLPFVFFVMVMQVIRMNLGLL